MRLHWGAVVRRLSVRDGDTDGGAQPGQPLIGDLPRPRHPSASSLRPPPGKVEIKIPEKRKRR